MSLREPPTELLSRRTTELSLLAHASPPPKILLSLVIYTSSCLWHTPNMKQSLGSSLSSFLLLPSSLTLHTLLLLSTPAASSPLLLLLLMLFLLHSSLPLPPALSPLPSAAITPFPQLSQSPTVSVPQPSFPGSLFSLSTFSCLSSALLLAFSSCCCSSSV